MNKELDLLDRLGMPLEEKYQESLLVSLEAPVCQQAVIAEGDTEDSWDGIHQVADGQVAPAEGPVERKKLCGTKRQQTRAYFSWPYVAGSLRLFVAE